MHPIAATIYTAPTTQKYSLLQLQNGSRCSLRELKKGPDAQFYITFQMQALQFLQITRNQSLIFQD